jgi:hypothetical protein
MTTSTSRRSTPFALMLALIVACVWLVGSCAALSSTLYAAQHSYCETEKVADSCLTLCAASDWDATPSVDQQVLTPHLIAGEVDLAGPTPELAIPLFVPVANHSPPLYLQHAAFLI